MEQLKGQEIGRAVITYDEAGNATTGTFYPQQESPACNETVKNLLAIKADANEHHIVQNAQSLLAEWFLKLEEVETADRTKQEIKSEIVGINRHPNGVPERVIIRFVFTTV